MAEKLCENHNKGGNEYDYYTIEEYKLNTPFILSDKYKTYEISMDHDGNVLNIRINKENTNPIVISWSNELYRKLEEKPINLKIEILQ